MDNKENPSEAEGAVLAAKEAPIPPKKPAKVTQEVFLTKWRDVLALEKDPVPKLRLMVRAGFLEEVNAGHASQLVTSLSEHGTVAERLGLRLAVQERFGKLNPLARRLLAELRTSFEKEINYEAAEFTGYRAPRALEDWVAEHAPAAPAAQRDSWFRRFIVCLMKDSETKTTVVGLVAASRRWVSSKGLKSSSADAAFIRGIALALSSPAIGASKLELILAGVSAVDEQFRKMLNRELDLERQIRTHQDSIGGLNNRVALLEGNVAKAVAEGEKKAADVAQLEQSLAAAQERYNLLDRHWRGVSEQELTKQSGTFREKVSQEVVEALLALNREDPNVEIALRRLRRIQEIVTK